MSQMSGCGKAYLITTGGFVERMLKAGEVLRVSVRSIAAIQSTVEIHAVRDDHCNADVSRCDAPMMLDLLGPGNIWLQSYPLPGVFNPAHQHAMELADSSFVRHWRTDYWNFAHPSFYL
jgi:uncharacterized protein (AIM24 family)